MPTETKTTTRIDRSKTYVCRFSCGFETNWPAARGRHEAARHNGHAPAHASVRAVSAARNGKPAGKPRQLTAPAKMDRLLDELREQHDEMLQALKKASLLVLAERDLRAREAAQIKSDLSAIYEVLERNRRDREPRLAASWSGSRRYGLPRRRPASFLVSRRKWSPTVLEYRLSRFPMQLRGNPLRLPTLQTVRRAE